MLVQDLKDVLVFLSFAVKHYMAHLGRLLIYFFIVLVLIIAVFFTTVRLTGSLWPFAAFLLLLVIGHLLLSRQVFSPFQIRLYRRLWHFLSGGRGDETVSAEELQKILVSSGELNKYSAARLSRRIRWAAAIVLTGSGHTWEPGSEEWRQAARGAILYLAAGYLLLFLLLAVFGSISLLFTLGMPPGVKLLIFTTGFIFAYFIYLAIIDPITGLMILRRIHRLLV